MHPGAPADAGAPFCRCSIQGRHPNARSGKLPPMDSSHAGDPDLPLLPRIAAGDPEACRTLVDRHLATVHATAARLLGDAAEADDVAQEVFLAAWQAARDWKPGRARFRTWMLRVATNACHDRHRRRRRIETDALDGLESTAPGPEQQTDSEQRGDNLAVALQALPERQRAAIVLCHFEECSQIEAADILDVSVDALESLLARGRRRLRDLMAAGE